MIISLVGVPQPQRYHDILSELFVVKNNLRKFGEYQPWVASFFCRSYGVEFKLNKMNCDMGKERELMWVCVCVCVFVYL